MASVSEESGEPTNTNTINTNPPIKPPPPTPKNPQYQIPIHHLLTQSRNSHGLSSSTTASTSTGGTHTQDEYSRYRSYCTRRLSRLRHAPPVKRFLTHGSKSAGAAMVVPSDGGGGGKKKRHQHAFHPRSGYPTTTININNNNNTTTDSSTPSSTTNNNTPPHVNYVLVALYETERAWAHGMELRCLYERVLSDPEGNHNNHTLSQTLNQSSKHASPGSIKRRYLRRLKKACGLVKLLEQMVESGGGSGDGEEKDEEGNKGSSSGIGWCDEATSVEVRAYGGWTRGNWFCETKDWKNACKEYAVALHLCEVLSKTTTTTATIVTDPTTDETLPNNEETTRALQRSDLFTARCRDVLQPLLRYCQYELRRRDGSSAAPDDVTEADILGEDGDGNNELTNAFLRGKLDSIRRAKEEEERGGQETECTVTFRGCTVRVEDRATRNALFRVRDLEREINSASAPTATGDEDAKKPKLKKKKKKPSKAKREADFLALLSGYDDVISTVSRQLSALEDVVDAGPAVAKKRTECRSLVGYCRHEKLKLSMGRNERVVEGLCAADRRLEQRGGGEVAAAAAGGEAKEDGDDLNNNNDDNARYKRVEKIAHVYDTLLQDARAVASLPGGASENDHQDDDSAVAEDDFLHRAEADVLRIRALRCYYLGRMHDAAVVEKHAEAIALYDTARNLAEEAREELLACDVEDDDERVLAMENLLEETTAARVRAEMGLFLGGVGGGGGGNGDGRALLDRLDDFHAGGGNSDGKGLDGSMDLKPLACKPMFFDMGAGFVGLEELVEELDGHTNVYSSKKSEGMGGGFFGRWFGSG